MPTVVGDSSEVIVVVEQIAGPQGPQGPQGPIGPAASSAGYVIWRPGGTTAGQVVATYAEIAPAIANGARALYIDSSLAPATTPGTGAVLELSMLVGIYSYNQSDAGTGDVLTVTDTDVLRDLPYVGPGLLLILDCSTSPALAYTAASPDRVPMLIVDSAVLLLGNAATVPAVSLSGELVVQNTSGAMVGNSPVALLHVGAGGVLAAVGVLDAYFGSDALGSDAGADIFGLDIDSSSNNPLPLSTSPGTPLTVGSLDNYLGLNGGAYVIFRPGGVSNGSVATTWADVRLANLAGAITLYIDSSLAPATTPGTGFAMPFFPGGIRGYNAAVSVGDLLTVADTDSLQYLRYVENLKIIFECTTSPALTYESSDLLWVNWGWLQMGATATVPAYTLPGGASDVFIVRQVGGTLEGVTAAPLFALTSTSTLVITSFDYAYLAANAVTGAAGCSVILVYDSSSPPLGAFADNGGTQAVPTDSDQSLAYGSGAANPATSPGGLPLQVGQPFYRTDLTIPVWYDGAAWRNAAAVVVP